MIKSDFIGRTTTKWILKMVAFQGVGNWITRLKKKKKRTKREQNEIKTNKQQQKQQKQKAEQKKSIKQTRPIY